MKDHRQEEHKHHEHEQHHDHSAMINDFKRRFFVCLILGLPVIVLSPMIQEILGYSLSFEGSTYLSAGLSSFIFFYGGWPFLTGLVSELKEKQPGMMTLIAIAITTAWAYSTAVVFGLEGKIFYWELVSLIAIMLLGHWLEMKSVMGASKALQKLAELMPDHAHRITDDDIEDVKTTQLQKGDLILVKPGEKIPADGTVKEGESELDESALTGESKPITIGPGQEVKGGAVNLDGSLRIEVLSTGEESYLNRVIKLVGDAQQVKSKTQTLANKAAGILAYVAIIAGAITLLVWWQLSDKDFSFALERMVTVMIITCPHALGLAVPLVSAISTAISAKNGLLIRNKSAFESARKIDTVVFDKTGTLTKGEFEVQTLKVTDNSLSNEELLAIAYALEQESEHPIARGIVKEAKKQSVKAVKVTDFSAQKGKGVEARIEGIKHAIVSPGYLKENNIDMPNEATEQKGTIVFVIRENSLLGYVALDDTIREESYQAIEELKSKDIEVLMATGDNENTAKQVAEAIGLDGYHSGVLPHEKSEIIERLQKDGKFVAMTGDGVNDAPALAKANVGIAIGSGTDIAAETADIILTESRPSDVVRLITFGKATYQKMIQNLVWATGYNVFAIPLAAGILYNQGIMISPALGAALMSLSTVICALNAQSLKWSIKK
ncbi:copper-translocating P-type ATPase [Roseivirga thermotolerans]|uniref:Heavy metal translocating P-type ATPase n=1 Tax=Roseivirga thermotolerans TaxID=1758176 RepID=A0ABQ3I9Z0_9BACT|nr:copper-translocating P-type ATPase [Roseivirga thermotolerans]GHE75313.1 heavy metal translocating P-type ATPase [Roseivirga thermotolerans]